MSKKKYVIKTVKETDPELFDSKVNELIEEGYWLQKSKAVGTEEEVYLIAFLDKKTKIEMEEESEEQPLESESVMSEM